MAAASQPQTRTVNVQILHSINKMNQYTGFNTTNSFPCCLLEHCNGNSNYERDYKRVFFFSFMIFLMRSSAFNTCLS